MIETVSGYLSALGLPQNMALLVAHVMFVLLVGGFSVLANMIAKKIILRLVTNIVRRTKNRWDDALVQRRVFMRLSHMAPALVIWYLAPWALPTSSVLVTFAQRLAGLYMMWVGASVVFAILSTILDVYNEYEVSSRVSITSFVQAAKIIVVIITGVLLFSIALGESPGVFIGGTVAFAAVIMLVLRQPILNLGASIWIISNQFVRKGDRIEIESFQIDGEVMEISLHAIVVRQNDMTFKSIPTHVLLTEGVKNWRGINAAGARRIQRSIWIDMGSIRFLGEDALQLLAQIPILAPYIESQRESFRLQREGSHVTAVPFVNGFALTNVSTFRAYVEAYLKQHPAIHQGHTVLVRQLQPKECGLPIEVYVAVNDTRWPEYERIQAEIFDHLLAALPYFDLRVYQGLSAATVSAAVRSAQSPEGGV